MMLDDYELVNGLWQRKPWLQKPRFFWPDCPCGGGGIPGCDFSDTFDTLDPAWSYFYDTTYRARQEYEFSNTTGGTFTLTYDGETTSSITYNALTINDDIASALNALAGISGASASLGLIRFTLAGLSNVLKLQAITADISGLTGTGTPALTIQTVPNFYVSSGKLVKKYYSGNFPSQDYATIYQSYTRPALSGLHITVSANVYFSTLALGVGVAVGGNSPNYGKWFSVVNASGGMEIRSAENNLQSAGFPAAVTGAAASGDKLTLEIIDTSSGAGTYTVQCYLNDVNVRSDSGVALTLPDPIRIGLVGGSGGTSDLAQWDNFCVTLS